MVGKAQKSHGARFDCMADVVTWFQRSNFSKQNTEFNSDLAPCDLWVFPTMKKEIRGKFQSD
jgi:hypothetical protein